MDFNKINFPSRLFISGIDTDAGKTFATGWLAKKMMESGLNVITQKFVQTGNTEFSEDIEMHRRIMGITPLSADMIHLTAPVIFTYPASPDLAARIDDMKLDLNVIDKATDTLSSQFSHILIEGAGGIMVPLIGNYLTIDYIKDRDLPVAIVTNGRLGSINHTLLTLDAVKHAGLRLFAVIYNTYFDKDKVIAKDTREYISRWVSDQFPETLYMEF